MESSRDVAGIIPPYDYVTRQAYEAQRQQRLALDDLVEDEAAMLRYTNFQERPGWYAADYLVCIRGITRYRKFSEVAVEPVPLDSQTAQKVRIITKMDKQDLVIGRQIISSVERGYFLSHPEIQNLAPEDIISQDNLVGAGWG